MANIDIKLTQAVEDKLAVLGGSIDPAAVLEQFATGAAQLDTLLDGAVNWELLDGGGVQVNLANGATLQLRGGAPWMTDGHYELTANAVDFHYPGVASLHQGGMFRFTLTPTANNELTLDSASLVTLVGSIATELPTTSPDYNADFGNVEVSFKGALSTDDTGAVSGVLQHMELQADHFIRSATIDGAFDVSGRLETAEDLASTFVNGVLTKTAIEFEDGSWFRVGDAVIDVDNDSTLDLTLLSNAAALAGNDTIKVALPAVLQETVTIASGGGNDAVTVSGGGLQLHVDGGEGNDVITLLTDGHQVVGGNGVDTVVYTGVRADFDVETVDEAIHVHNLQGIATDTLTGVERIQYTDAAVAYDINGNAGAAYRLYLAAFDRAPDFAGLGYWMSVLDRGAPLLDAANAFVSSPEFTQLYGAGVSDGKFLELLYANVMHRAPDAGGLAYWSDALADGLTRATVLREFSESTENRAQVIGQIEHGITYTPY